MARDGVHDRVIEFLQDKPRGKVLDIPTGYGALAKQLYDMHFTVSCCDINTDQFLVDELKVDKGDLNEHIPYSDGEFDYVCFLEAVEHTENPYNAIRQVARVLKPGGTLIMSTPNYLNIERRLKFLVTGFFTRPVSQNTFRNHYRGEVYGMHLSPIGYTIIRFAIERAGLQIMQIAYDKKKKKQALLKPLIWFIRFYAKLWPKSKREKYWLAETTGDTILDGGNTLIIFARKL